MEKNKMADQQHHQMDMKLLEWIERIAQQYENNRIADGENPSPAIQALRRKMKQQRARLDVQVPHADTLREMSLLIAPGVLNWHLPADTPPHAISGEILKNFFCAALSPLVRKKRLPYGWYNAVREITSPELTQFTVTLP
jgi:hypothetical protein